MTYKSKLLVVAAGIATVVGLANLPLVSAQSATAGWEEEAGAKLFFDVASVKQNKSGIFSPPNFPLDDGDAYTADASLFSATDFPITTFIGFAYKLSLIQRQALDSQLPKWAETERFDIDARAPKRSTKNQMRLMMQSLLASRFKLAAHFETHQGPVFALRLVKPGKTGPQLRPYSNDPPCSVTMPSGNANVSTTPPKTALEELPPICGWLMLQNVVSATSQIGTVVERRVTMQQLANDLPDIPTSTLDRPVVDETGLTGPFDFVMKIELNSATSARASQSNEGPPTFLEALKDQLGLKLVAARGPVEMLVIDHIEEPTPN